MTNGINWGNNTIVQNPYNFVPQFQIQAPHMEVVKVKGEKGADALQMGPNSSGLFLDADNPIIWFVQTDGAGYKTKTPYDISLHVEEPSPDIKTMDERLMSIDKRLQAIEEALNDESDS